jgi:hypothetical protein
MPNGHASHLFRRCNVAAEAASVDQFGVNPVAPGPYEVAKLVHSGHVTLVAYGHYRTPTPSHRSVTIREVSDASMCVSGLSSGTNELSRADGRATTS